MLWISSYEQMGTIWFALPGTMAMQVSTFYFAGNIVLKLTW